MPTVKRLTVTVALCMGQLPPSNPSHIKFSHELGQQCDPLFGPTQNLLTNTSEKASTIFDVSGTVAFAVNEIPLSFS